MDGPLLVDPNPHFFNFHSALKSRQRFIGTRDSEAQMDTVHCNALDSDTFTPKVQIAKVQKGCAYKWYRGLIVNLVQNILNQQDVSGWLKVSLWIVYLPGLRKACI